MYISWETPRKKNEKLSKRYVKILVQIPSSAKSKKQGCGGVSYRGDEEKCDEQKYSLLYRV